jgi:hypothetical protein
LGYPIVLHWEYPGTGFTLDLSQNAGQIQGMHVVVAQGGDNIDSLDNSIKGEVKGAKAAVTFQSSFAADAGTAEISVIDSNTIFWKIITTPTGSITCHLSSFHRAEVETG